MGRNNLENKERDKSWGWNKTQRRLFKFELVSEKQCRNFELAQGLEMHKLTIAINVNAKRFPFKMNDKIELKGTSYIVVAIADNHDNPNQGRYKGNLDDYTGTTTIGLE